MRSFWCILVILSVFYMSVDAAADSVSKGHAHGGEAAHLLDDSLDEKSDAENDHCERCCHGHTASLTMDLASALDPLATSDHGLVGYVHVRNFGQAPPTPPPTV